MAGEADVQLATMLCVHDLERSLAFYLALGFTLVEREEDIALTPPKSSPWGAGAASRAIPTAT